MQPTCANTTAEYNTGAATSPEPVRDICVGTAGELSLHLADARRIFFHGLSAETVLAAMMKVKPEPKKAAKRRRKVCPSIG